jgi:hypothetical protein
MHRDFICGIEKAEQLQKYPLFEAKAMEIAPQVRC